MAARPPSSGWANSTSGRASVTPRAARSKRWKNGDVTASGCAAEQTSCQKPGRVSSSVRQPPPIVGAPSMTCTRSPAAAIVRAAARPFGPLPTTTASNSPRMADRLPAALLFMPCYRLTVSTTVIVWPPGFTVSCPSSATRLVEVTVIVTLAPEASEPEEGETLMRPASADPAVIE